MLCDQHEDFDERPSLRHLCARPSVPLRQAGAPGASLDIENILQGYSPGRELGAARDKLPTLNGFDRDELAMKIACAEAAQTWQLQTIHKQSTTALQQAWQVLDEEDYVLPEELRWNSTAKFAKECVEHFKLQEWSSRPRSTGSAAR